MNYFVYFNNGYADDGDVGFEEFDSKQLALDFISGRAERQKQLTDETLNQQFILIEGRSLPLKSAQRITSVVENRG